MTDAKLARHRLRSLLAVYARTERAAIAPWLALLTALAVTSMLAFAWVFPDAASQAALERSVGANPTFKLVFGPALNLRTGEGFTAWRSGQLGYLFAGLMAILLVVRLTRAKEDSGEAELVGATALPRSAQLSAALVFSTLVALALGVVSTAATIACGGAPSQIPYVTLGYTGAALCFGAVAAVCSQVASDARAASTYAIVCLGAAFLLRGSLQVLDAPRWTDLLSPFGWLSEVGASVDNRSWPFIALVGCAAMLWTLAFRLQARRDFGRGLVGTRAGRSQWPRRLPLLRLVLRLNRGTVAAWSWGLGVVGGVFGYLATSMSDLLTNNPGFAAALASGAVTRDQVTFEFLGMLLKLAGLLAAAAAAGMIQRLATEEVERRGDPVLAGAVTRTRHYAAYSLTALAVCTLLMVWAGTLMAIVSSNVDSQIDGGLVFRQSLATIPASLLLAACSALLVGLHPTRRQFGWLAIVGSFALTILAPLFNLWDWVDGISPYWHVPNVAAIAPDWWSLLRLTAIAATFTALGFIGYRRRDLL